MDRFRLFIYARKNLDVHRFGDAPLSGFNFNLWISVGSVRLFSQVGKTVFEAHGQPFQKT